MSQAEQLSPEDFRQLLEAYESALRLSAFDAIIERREKLIDAYEAKPLRDGEFRLEGNLFGAWLVARGRIHAKEARSPDTIAAFMGELVMRMMMGIEQVIEQHKRRSDTAGGN